MMKLACLFIIVISVMFLSSCFVDKGVPSTPVPNNSEDDVMEANDTEMVDTAVVPAVRSDSGSAGTGGTSSEPVSRPNAPDARTSIDKTDAGVIIDIESDDAEVVDAREEASSLEEFGLSCGGVLCPSVAVPAKQCCTQQLDVEKRRSLAEDRCGIARLGVEGCIELEQMGTLDDRCPAYQPIGASVEEPGCCTTEGRCGTFDVADGSGCHENQSIDQACGEEAIDESVTCEPTGIYAVKAELDLAWGGQSGMLFDITDDDRGMCTIILKITIDNVDADNAFVARVDPCGAELPLISNSLICESYRPTFSNEIWDKGTVPPISVPGSFNCSNPGCLLSIGPASASIGIDLEDEGSAWPSAGEANTIECPAGIGSDCFPDHDGDGYPGITVTMPDGDSPGSQSCPAGYRVNATPLSANISIILDSVFRTDRLHLGIRVRLGASGRLTHECGLADVAGMAEFVQSRAIGCMLKPGTADLFATPAGPNDYCNEEQLLFMDQSLPVYDILRLGDVPNPFLDLPSAKRVPSEGPRFQLIRIGDKDDDVSCPDVRDAF